MPANHTPSCAISTLRGGPARRAGELAVQIGILRGRAAARRVGHPPPPRFTKDRRVERGGQVGHAVSRSSRRDPR